MQHEITKYFNKMIVLFLSIAFVSFFLAGCGSTKDSTSSSDGETASEELTTVKCALYSNYVTNYIEAINEEQHIYEKYGINFDGYEFSMGVDAMNAVTTGTLDLAFVADYAGINRLGSSDDNNELRIFAQLTDYTSLDLWASENITTPKDLEGKTVVTIAGTIYDYFYDKLFEYYDIDKSKVTIVSVTSSQEALSLAATGDADAYWPTAADEAKFTEYGWKKLVSSSDYNTGRYQLCVAQDSYLNENQETIVNWLKATQELIDYMYENEEEAAEIVEEKTVVSKETFILELHEYNFGVSFTQQTYEKNEELNQWLYTNEYYDKIFNIKDYLNLNAIREAFPDKVEYTE